MILLLAVARRRQAKPQPQEVNARVSDLDPISILRIRGPVLAVDGVSICRLRLSHSPSAVRLLASPSTFVRDLDFGVCNIRFDGVTKRWRARGSEARPQAQDATANLRVSDGQESRSEDLADSLDPVRVPAWSLKPSARDGSLWGGPKRFNPYCTHDTSTE